MSEGTEQEDKEETLQPARKKKPAGEFTAPDVPPPETPPPEVASRETREILKSLKHDKKVQAAAERSEAEDFKKRGAAVESRVRKHQKVRDEAVKHQQYVKDLMPKLGVVADRPITEIPEIDREKLAQVEFSTIQEGRAYVRILYDKARNQYLYEVIEPGLTQPEEDVLAFLRDTLVRTLPGRFEEEGDWEQFLMDAIDQAIVDHSVLIDEVSKQRIQYYLLRDFLGYGPIDVLLRDPLIEDISCDGPNIPIYLFHRQYESIKTNVIYKDETVLDSFVIRLAQRCGKHISIAEPILDATLPDGSRLQATLSREVTTRGSSFTVRKFRTDPLTPPDLVRLGTMSAAQAAYFWLAMEEGFSVIFAGGTASGKTSSLNAASMFIPPQKKIVSIEDTREVNLPHENWIAGLTRAGFGSDVVAGRQSGAVDMYKLLEAALRQRPEFLLVGEVRGAEALTLFQAMATGHACYSTMHADSAQSAVYRLENEPINVPRLMLQTLDAIAIQIQVRINQRLVRRIKEVVEIVGIDPDTGDMLTNTVFRWDAKRDAHEYMGKSQILESIMETKNLARPDLETEWDKRTRIIEWMVEKGIRNVRDVGDIVSAYYSTPDTLLARVTETTKSRPGDKRPGGDA